MVSDFIYLYVCLSHALSLSFWVFVFVCLFHSGRFVCLFSKETENEDVGRWRKIWEKMKEGKPGSEYIIVETTTTKQTEE